MKTQLLLFLSIFYFTFVSYAQWSTDVRITNDTFYSGNPFAFVSGSDVHIVWEDARDGNTEIYYKRSSDNGLSWSPETRLTNDPNYSYKPTVVVSGTIVHVVWRDSRSAQGTQVHYRRSSDNGITWGIDTSLTTAGANTPTMSSDGSLVCVVWEDHRNGNNDIYFKRSTNNGISWLAETRLTFDVNNSYYPHISISDQSVHLVWYENRNGNYEIYYKRSSDDGINWSGDVMLTNNTEESKHPTVSTCGLMVHVTWNDLRDLQNQIYYKRSTDGGLTWGNDTRLSTAYGTSIGPLVLSTPIAIHVVWTDTRDLNMEVYYKRSTDAGNSWGADTRLTNDPANSWAGSLGVSGSIVHVIWDDTRDGHSELYYKRNPTGNPIGISPISSNIPADYKLEQNFPNPFNPVTKIQFQIPKSGFVSLEIYDALGRNISALVNENLNPGVYEVEWNAVKQPSGIYFYRIIAPDFSDVKKMVLVK